MHSPAVTITLRYCAAVLFLEFPFGVPSVKQQGMPAIDMIRNSVVFIKFIFIVDLFEVDYNCSFLLPYGIKRTEAVINNQPSQRAF